MNTVAEFARDSAGNRMMLHLLNYDSRETVQNIEVDLAIPAGAGVKSVSLLSPDDGMRQEARFRVSDARARFLVPRLAKYGLAVVELSR